jgi:hypothetical protein
MPDAGGWIAGHLRGELVSGFARTDREERLRDRAWALVMPPHARDWLGAVLVEGQRTRILPEVDHRFDARAYYGRLMGEGYRSSETRWTRIIDDMRQDAALVGPFWAEARGVRADDAARVAAVDARRSLGPDELKDAYARIDENARLVDWVWRALNFRLRCYRFAIDRLAVETPGEQRALADLGWTELRLAIRVAESEEGGGEVARVTPMARPGRARAASADEPVPQK